jgi:hypothetical protein
MSTSQIGAPYAEFSAVMAPAVWRAARLARALEGRVPNQPKAGEVTAVKQALTVADPAAQEQVLEHLRIHYPDVSLAAEEDSASVDGFGTGSKAVVVIDPIDGTLHSYLEGGGPYAVIVGLAMDGLYTSGVVALPREGLLFRADAAGGAVLERASGAVRPAQITGEGRRILVSHGMPAKVSAWLVDHGYEVISSCGGAVAVAPLIPGVVGGVRYASGAGGVSIRGRVGVLISRAAGARVVGDGEQTFPADMDTPSHTLRIAGSDALIKVLGEALKAGGVA